MHPSATKTIPITNITKGNCRHRQHNEFSVLNLQRLNVLKVLQLLVVASCGLLFSIAEAGRGEIFEIKTNGTEEEIQVQKNYEEDEADTLVPHR